MRLQPSRFARTPAAPPARADRYADRPTSLACRKRSISGLRPDHPAHAQAGKADLGKAAQQHRAAAVVQLLDGRQRLRRDSAIRRRRRSRSPGRPPRARLRSNARARAPAAGSRRSDSGNSKSPPGTAAARAPGRAPAAPMSMPSAPTGMPISCAPMPVSRFFKPGIDRSSTATVSPGRSSTRPIRSSACWQPLVIMRSSPGAASPCRARLFQQIAAQRLVAARRAQLQDIGEIVPRQHGVRNSRGNRPAGKSSREGREHAKLMHVPGRAGPATAAASRAFQQVVPIHARG